MKIVEWVEPYASDTDIILTCQLSQEDAIKFQIKSVTKSHPDFKYENEEQALFDFMTVHWAYFMER